MSAQAADPIAIALAEDLGDGDVTCRYFVDADRKGKARIFAKEPAVAAGVEVAAEVFRRVDPKLTVVAACSDGDAVQVGETILTISGPVTSILTAERTALNFLQRLSGVATVTRRFVEAAGKQARVLDTRKTTPGLRALEKAAVKAGGGTNHRFGLYDMVLVKDNHLAAGSTPERLQEAIDLARSAKPGIRVELEADTLDQVRSFLQLRGVDVILLDNMTCAQMKEAVALRDAKGNAKAESNSRVELEASGGIALETIRSIAETGVDYISAGALTHSARAIDYSLELLNDPV